MSKLTRFNLFLLAIVSLCLALFIGASPGVANKPRRPQPRAIVSNAPLPYQQPVSKTSGTAGCTMTRSDGSTVNLDRICGSNILLESKDPGAIRASDLEWGTGGMK